MFYLFVTLIVVALFVVYLFMQGGLTGYSTSVNEWFKNKFPSTPFNPGGAVCPTGPAANVQAGMKEGDVLVIVKNQYRILSCKQAPEVIIGRDPAQSDMITSEYCSGQHCHLSVLPNGQLHVKVKETNSNGSWKKTVTVDGDSNLFEITGMEETISLPENHLPVYLLLSAPDEENADVVTLIRL